MPVEQNIGFGPQTPRKLDNLELILKMHLNITRKVIEKWNERRHYRYIDLTAGTGIVPTTDDPGSALIFLHAAEEVLGNAVVYRADLIEKEPANFRQLQSNVGTIAQSLNSPHNRVFLHLDEYQTAIPNLLGQGDSKEYGIVFVDHSGDLPDLATLQLIAESRRKMEILIYLAATNIKRVYPMRGLRLEDYIREVRKKNWLIRRSAASDPHQWTFLLGTNASNIFRDYKRIGLYRVDSEDGQSILEKLNLTRNELVEKRQPRLFEPREPYEVR